MSDSSLSDPENLKSTALLIRNPQVLFSTIAVKFTNRVLSGSTKDYDELPDRIHENPDTASVPRVAGGFTPFQPHHLDPEDQSEIVLHPVAFVRNSVTIWFDKEGDKWKKGQFQACLKTGVDL